MDNPLVYALKKSGMSTSGLAIELKVSRQLISRLQYGCAVNLTDSMVNWIRDQISGEFEGVTEEAIQKWYQAWKHYKRLKVISIRSLEVPKFTYFEKTPEIKTLMDRESHVEYFRSISDFRVKAFDRESFIRWRKKNWPSTYRFAVDMCITPAAVDRYEKGDYSRIAPEMVNFFEWLEKNTPVAKEANANF